MSLRISSSATILWRRPEWTYVLVPGPAAIFGAFVVVAMVASTLVVKPSWVATWEFLAFSVCAMTLSPIVVTRIVIVSAKRISARTAILGVPLHKTWSAEANAGSFADSSDTGDDWSGESYGPISRFFSRQVSFQSTAADPMARVAADLTEDRTVSCFRPAAFARVLNTEMARVRTAAQP